MEWSQIEARWVEMTRRVQSHAEVELVGNVGALEPALPAADRTRSRNTKATAAPDNHITE